ncbi:MAG: hypothetical protein OEV92_05030 [Nitrospinota bacterium]|nr:hypothetical protein [Nitrospinota bacterium]
MLLASAVLSEGLSLGGSNAAYMVMAGAIVSMFTFAWSAKRREAVFLGNAPCQACGKPVGASLDACPACGAAAAKRKLGWGSIVAGYAAGSVMVFFPLYIFLGQMNQSRHHHHSSCPHLKSDLANMAIAEEAYWTDYDAYTIATSEPGLPGFKPGMNMKLAVIRTDKDSFTLIGSHGDCDQNDDGQVEILMFDSSKGGLQQKPKTDPQINMGLGILLAAAIGDRQMLDTYMAGYKSDISKIQLQGATPLSLAKRGGYKEIVARLKAAGAGKPAAP